MSAVLPQQSVLSLTSPEVEPTGWDRYSMPRATRDAETARYLATVIRPQVRGSETDMPSGRFIGVEVTDADAEMADVARGLEAEVFGKAFGDTPDALMQLYGPHESNSRFFVVIDTERRRRASFKKSPSVVGVMRVGEGYVAEALTISKAAEELADPATGNKLTVDQIKQHHGIHPSAEATGNKVWDIMTMAIDPAYRAGSRLGRRAVVTALLQRMFINAGEKSGITKVFTLIDSGALRGLKSIGIPFEDVAGIDQEFAVEGSAKSRAQFGDLTKFRPAASRRYEELSERTSNEGVVSRIKRYGLVKALFKDPIKRNIAGMASKGINNIDRSLTADLRF